MCWSGKGGVQWTAETDPLTGLRFLVPSVELAPLLPPCC